MLASSSKDCPKCSRAMEFLPADSNWWCSDCLHTESGSGDSAPRPAEGKISASSSGGEAAGNAFDNAFDHLYWWGVPIATLGLIAFLFASGHSTGGYIVSGLFAAAIFFSPW